MVLELVEGIGAQYRTPFPHEGKSSPMILSSLVLYSPEFTSLPFPVPQRIPLRSLTQKKKREQATPKRGGDDGRGDGRLTPIANVLSVAEPPKCLGPPTSAIVLRTSDGDAGSPPTLEVR